MLQKEYMIWKFNVLFTDFWKTGRNYFGEKNRKQHRRVIKSTITEACHPTPGISFECFVPYGTLVQLL
jgi:hypothetical protein